MKLTDELKKIGINNVEELPEKTKLKFKEYLKIVNNPGFYKDKKTDDWKPGAKVKLQSLAEDILTEAHLFIEDQENAIAEKDKTDGKDPEDKTQNGKDKADQAKTDEGKDKAQEDKTGQDDADKDKESKDDDSSKTKKKSSWTSWILPDL